MEGETAEKEMGGVTDTDEEVADGDSTSVTSSTQWEARLADDCELEDKTDFLKSQDTPNSATPQDSGIGDGEAEYSGSVEAKEDAEEASDGFDHDSTEDHENLHVINQEEDEAAKEQHVNGESGWRNEGTGRRCKLRSSSVLMHSKEEPQSSVLNSLAVGGLLIAPHSCCIEKN